MPGRWLVNGAVLGAAAGAAALVAAACGRPAWAAALGGGLAVACWAVELLTWRQCSARGSFSGAVAVAAAGAGVRVALVLATLTALGLFARPAFATAALAFLAGFTVHSLLRLVRPAVAVPAVPGGGR